MLIPGVYMKQLGSVVGVGAFDSNGHMNTKCLHATTIGPYPRECQEAWDTTRHEVINNYGLLTKHKRDEWEMRLGPLLQPTPA
jgi:hypothetical protein